MTAALSDEHWQDLAACRGTDTERFFPISHKSRPGADVEFALGMCMSCPVQQPCLRYAMSFPQTHGIWGGTTEEQRKRLRHEVLRAQRPPAGLPDRR